MFACVCRENVSLFKARHALPAWRNQRRHLSVPKLSFDGQTAIVTGAGRGLGKEYALLLASRGANVVVNDFGGDKANRDQTARQSVAQQVAEEIAKLSPGAQTHVDLNSISTEEGARQLVESTLQKFGRLDILINNAGILRDVSFSKMTLDDWDQVQSVHLRGSFLVSHACWPHMRKQQFGRIIMTGSTSGLFGNFGQANYAAAKMGLVGLSNTLAIEGRRDNIHCNAVIPMAASRMTRNIIPPELAARLHPAYVAPLVAWLCHTDCQESGLVLEAAGGWYGRYSLRRTIGKFLPELVAPNGQLSDTCVESIAQNWHSISSPDGDDQQAVHLESSGDHLSKLLSVLEGNHKS